MSTTNEMNDAYADGDLGASVSVVQTSDTPSDSMAIGTPVVAAPAPQPKKISVYAGNITQVSYESDSPIAAFDIVFTVSVYCPESQKSESYQVVKRIGVDREKIAAEACSSTPVSVVESKKSDAGKRLLELAGLK